MKELQERIRVDEAKGEVESYTIFMKDRGDLTNNKKNMCMIV